MRDKLINDLYTDIYMLQQGNLYELVKAPGRPKCSTLAYRMEKNLDKLIAEYDEELQDKKMTDHDKFEMLSDLLDALSKEFSELSKKQPDALVNSFKVEQLNRVLIPLKEIMKGEPTIGFLDLVAEPITETRNEKARHTYSDVAVILSQFKEACRSYRHRHYHKEDGWSITI